MPTAILTARQKRVKNPSKPHPHPLPLIESLNALPLQSYCSRLFPYLPPFLRCADTSLTLGLESADTISKDDLGACFRLIEESSGEAYADSSMGWSPTKKRKEMKLPDLRYFLLRGGAASAIEDGGEWEGNKGKGGGVGEGAKEGDGDGQSEEEGGRVQGFASFMLTYEDGHEVIYLYEIHLSPALRGQNVGEALMRLVEEGGRRAGVSKAMLTTFKSNGGARRFYERLGYEEDEYSPRPRKMRNGVVKEADYVILSKRLKLEEEGFGWQGKRKKMDADGE